MRCAGLNLPETGIVRVTSAVQLDASIHEYQLAISKVPVVTDPVEGGGVVSTGGDRVVADRVARMTSVQSEDALHPALAATGRDGARQLGDDSLEARGGGAAGSPHLLELERVLHQSQLAQGYLELGVAVVCSRSIAPGRVDHGGDRALGLGTGETVLGRGRPVVVTLHRRVDVGLTGASG